MKNSKFDFYEVVKVTAKELTKIFGREAVVLAKSQNDDGKWGYGISVEQLGGWDVDEDQIESLGRFVKREDIYTGESVKVCVDKNGKGCLKEE